jgi:hypothetical protein
MPSSHDGNMAARLTSHLGIGLACGSRTADAEKLDRHVSGRTPFAAAIEDAAQIVEVPARRAP